MIRYNFIFLLILITSCHTTRYYIVRHAEKEYTNTMTSDVPLSGTGKERAKALADKLKEQHIAAIYSTSFKRTVATVEPLSHITGDPIQFYNTDTLAGFISGLRKIHTGNVVIAGHSNTMGDIINRLSGKDYLQGNLPDSAYGDLFIVIKKGKKYTFRKEHFGQ